MQLKTVFAGLIASLCLSGAVQAGSITIGLASGSPALNLSKTYTVADVDVARVIAAARAMYPKNPDGTDASQAQSLAQWADSIRDTIAGQVQAFERAQATPAPISAQ